jgi:hypothetical protein
MQSAIGYESERDDLCKWNLPAGTIALNTPLNKEAPLSASRSRRTDFTIAYEFHVP